MARAFQALRHRNYRLFWSGQASSLTGNWMQTIGESWLVYRVTGSPVALGAVSFVALLPVLPISLFGSALIDRMPRRKLLLGTQVALACTAFAWAALAWSQQIQLWQIVLLSFLEGAIASVDLPARQAFLPELVGRADLPNGIALSNSLYNAARIVGPTLAGLVIANAGEGACFLINGLSFLPFIACLAMIRDLRPREQSAEATRSGGVMLGVRYVLGSASLIWLLALMAVSTLLLLSYSTLMPVIAKDVLAVGPQGLGLLMTSVGLGAMLGSLWLASLDSQRLMRWLVLGLYMLPLSVIAFTTARELALAMAIALVAGINTTWMQTILNTLVQLHVPDHVRGRTLSIYLALSVGMQRVGGMEAGFLAQIIGVSAALRVGAVLSLFFTTIALWRRPLPVGQSAVPATGAADAL